MLSLKAARHGMITNLVINRFKNHRGTRLSFGRFTLLAGPNGVGKTNVLKALLVLQKKSANSDATSEKKVSEGDDLILKGKEEFMAWEASAKETDDANWINFDGDGDSALDRTANSFLLSVEDVFSDWFFLKPKSEGLSPSYTPEIPPLLKSDGRELASVIAHLMTSAPKRFERIMKAFQKIVPQVEGIRATREKVFLSEKKSITLSSSSSSPKEVVYEEPREVTGDALLFDMTGAEGLSASEVSDGTLVTLVILTAIHQSKTPRLLLLDDIETGLHPSAQQILMDQIRAILDLNPDLQIIATTHSPYIIDKCDSDEVYILAPDMKGVCHCRKMSEHPNAKSALKVLTTGEFWSAEGENWVIENVDVKGNTETVHAG